MSEFRAIGTAVEFTSATDIALTATLTGTGSATINSSDSPYLQIPAGSVWRLPDLCNFVCFKVQAWLFAAITADGGVTKSSFALTDFTVTFTVSPSLTVNGSLFTFKITNGAGAHLKIGGTNAALTAVSLTNTNGLWSKFGLTEELNTSQAMTVGSNIATQAGVFTPRSIFFFLRSEIDEGDTEEPTHYRAKRFADGTGSVYHSGRSVAHRIFRLVDLDEDIAGRPRLFARLGDDGLNANRVTLQLNTISSTFSSGSTNAIDSLYWRSGDEFEGRYLLLPGCWVSRALSSLDDPTGIQLCEKVPSGLTPPAACPILVISEVHALHFEALRTGYFIIYDSIEELGTTFGTIRWLSTEYMIAEDSVVWAPERRDIGAPIYSFTWRLLRRDASGLTLTEN